MSERPCGVAPRRFDVLLWSEVTRLQGFTGQSDMASTLRILVR